MYETMYVSMCMCMCLSVCVFRANEPFCMSASMVYVVSAPANRSDGDFSPFTVGIASMSCTTGRRLSHTHSHTYIHTCMQAPFCISHLTYICIHIQRLHRSGDGVLGRSLPDRHTDIDIFTSIHTYIHTYTCMHAYMSGVALLPEELGAAQERSGSHLPAHHVGP